MLLKKAANKGIKILAFNPKFTYNDLLGRPVDPVSINALINTDLVFKSKEARKFCLNILGDH